MSSRRLLMVSVVVAVAGAVLLALTATDRIAWDRGDAVALGLLIAAVYLLGLAVLAVATAIRRDMALIRDRTKGTAENVTRTAARVEEVRRELLLGPFSHLPGQVGRLEGWLQSQEQDASSLPPSHSATTAALVFDAVYVLNLDTDQSKLERTAEMLLRHGVTFTRFPAVDGNDATFDAEWERYLNKDAELPPERFTGNRLIESRGAWGYLKTMQALLLEARERSLSRILVLEDDIMLHRNFEKRFAEVWPELPADWKIVYLGSVLADASRATRFSDHLYHPGAMANGSYAVAIDSSVFDQALASIERFDWPFDAGALREIDASHPTKVFAVEPPLVIADVSASSIRPGRDLAAHAKKHGWSLGDYETSSPR